ncbi:MAG: twin-arginine translocation signal domain-containing protein [Chloroflexi bacterium]|nr:MAG: twin-arginine translocation signal domain-containing protein [Chloroflexota bacterium]
MKDQVSRRQILKGVAAAGVLGGLSVPSAAFANGDEGNRGGSRIRWDLIELNIIGGAPELKPGGEATARAEDDSALNLTGSGTFRPGHPRQVTGGGKWSTDNTDVGPSSGTNNTYRVTELISWHPAPGSLPPTADDDIGNREDARSGLAVLRIAYSDGLDGVLVVSCMLPVGSPHSMDEGFNATRHFVNFFHPDPPTAGNHSNRTAFHVLRHGEDD